MKKEDLEKEQKKLLKKLEVNFRRITDGIVEKMLERPSAKRSEKKEIERSLTKSNIDKLFVGDDLITEVGQYHLIRNYMLLLDTEQQHFDSMRWLLETVPIYTEFLEKVPGIGPAMAGVIVSEIDIHKAEYPSSICAYAGLDVVAVVEYQKKRADGKVATIRLNLDQASASDELEQRGDGFYYQGKKCLMTTVGRSRREESLVDRTYVKKTYVNEYGEKIEGEEGTRKSISFNPFLKTKLLGVAAGSMIKAGAYRVDGK
ncbi:MAG TPA: transposase, partial [Anaerolineales bacterium]|nr:transposase [Anaerolineales bacterium]